MPFSREVVYYRTIDERVPLFSVAVRARRAEQAEGERSSDFYDIRGEDNVLFVAFAHICWSGRTCLPGVLSEHRWGLLTSDLY